MSQLKLAELHTQRDNAHRNYIGGLTGILLGIICIFVPFVWFCSFLLIPAGILAALTNYTKRNRIQLEIDKLLDQEI